MNAVLYTKESTAYPTFIDVDGLMVRMPKKPPLSEFVNYGLPKKEQKFVHRSIPKGISDWSYEKIETYARREWHYRINGYWILINGHQVYIPQGADTFFNWWTTEGGGRPDFRYEAVKFFQSFYLAVEDDPTVFGMVDIKCRRLGDTEKSIFIMWERSTRFRNRRAGMQHLNDTDAKKNFDRLVIGAMGMPFFFKPIHRGSDTPSEVLIYDKPSEIMTGKKLREQSDSSEALVVDSNQLYLGSRIDYEASVTGKYDGQILHSYHGDEVFKLSSSRLDPIAQLSNILRVTSLNNTARIIGKTILTSTVEEMEDGRMIDVATKLWEESNPDIRDANGRTVSGLIRVFRGYLNAADVDEYGFPDEAEAKRFRDEALRVALESGNMTEYMSIMRKAPSCIEDALTVPKSECVLHPDLCDLRLMQLREGKNWNGEDEPCKMVEGDLAWKNGVFGGEVYFVPRIGGRFNISKHPNHLANNVGYVNGVLKPLNRGVFRIGCDPYDADETQVKGSNGAAAVRMLFVPELETKTLLYNDRNEVVNTHDLETDQFVCDYSYRPKNPYDFYEDMLKLCFYYGSEILVEKDKPGILVWFKAMGFGSFLQYESTVLNKKKVVNQGVKATADVVSRYVEMLSIHVATRVQCTHLPRLIKQWRGFSKANRTKFDLAVASGFGEMATGKVKKRSLETPSAAWEKTTMYE